MSKGFKEGARLLSLNKDLPPLYNQLSPEDFKELVDIESFPKCSSCGQPIYNPDFYDEEMCGPCMTGEAATIMKHREEYSSKELKIYISKLETALKQFHKKFPDLDDAENPFNDSEHNELLDEKLTYLK